MAGLPRTESVWTGFALRGGAIVMALAAMEQIPDFSAEIMNIVISSTIFSDVFKTMTVKPVISKTLGPKEHGGAWKLSRPGRILFIFSGYNLLK